MKRIFYLILLSALVSCNNVQDDEPDPVVKKSEKDSVVTIVTYAPDTLVTGKGDPIYYREGKIDSIQQSLKK